MKKPFKISGDRGVRADRAQARKQKQSNKKKKSWLETRIRYIAMVFYIEAKYNDIHLSKKGLYRIFQI